MYKSKYIGIYFCQNEVKLRITIFHVKSIRFFGISRENTSLGLPLAFFDEKTLKLKNSRNSLDFPVKY